MIMGLFDRIFAKKETATGRPGTPAKDVKFQVRCAECKKDTDGKVLWRCNDCFSEEYALDETQTPIKWEHIYDRARGFCQHCAGETTGRVVFRCTECLSDNQPRLFDCSICCFPYLFDTEMRSHFFSHSLKPKLTKKKKKKNE